MSDITWFRQVVLNDTLLTNILLVCVVDHVVGRAVDEEIFEAPDEAVPESAGPQRGRQPQVGVHVVHATHEQTADKVQLGSIA